MLMELDNVHHLINDDQMVLLLGWLSLLRRTKRGGSVAWSQAEWYVINSPLY